MLSARYDIIAEHEYLIRREVSPRIEYVEKFYYKKLIAGKISIQSVYLKLQNLPFSQVEINHIFNHLKYMLERYFRAKEVKEEVSRPPEPRPEIVRKLSYKQKQRLAFKRIKTGLSSNKERYSKTRAWVKDRLGRVHHVNAKTGRFTRIPKHLKTESRQTRANKGGKKG